MTFLEFVSSSVLDDAALLDEVNLPRLAWKSFQKDELLDLLEKNNGTDGTQDWLDFVDDLRANGYQRVRFTDALGEFVTSNASKAVLFLLQEPYTHAANMLDREATADDVAYAKKLLAVQDQIVAQQDKVIQDQKTAQAQIEQATAMLDVANPVTEIKLPWQDDPIAL